MPIDPSRDPPRNRRRQAGSKATVRGLRRRSKVRALGPAGRRWGEAQVASLQLLVARLRTVFGMAITAELALRAQGAERDVEIADCLRGGVSEPLAGEIERLDLLAERERHFVGGPGFRRESGRVATRRGSMMRKGRPLHQRY